MKIHWRAKFIGRKRGADGTLEMLMRLTLRGQKPVDFATGLRVPAECWDDREQTAKPVSEDARELNRTINEWSALLSEMFSRYSLVDKRVPARDEARDLFNDLSGRSEKKTAAMLARTGERLSLYACFDLFVKTAGAQNQWAKNTYCSFAKMRKSLVGFDPLLDFSDLTNKRAQEYVQHLTGIGLRNSSISRYTDMLRWFLRWACKEGHYEGKVHDTFRPRFRGVSGEKDIIYLTLDEVGALRALQFGGDDRGRELERVRDAFVFCCFCGLRYSDVQKLRWSDIKADHLQVVTKKTADAIRIELNAQSRAILDKYRPKSPAPSELVLPCVSIDKANIRIKAVCRLAGINTQTRRVWFCGAERHEEVAPKWQLVTTHAARRTFVVLALQLGISSEVIMRWTGHSCYEAMKPYMAIADSLKRDSMSRFDKL